MSAKTQRAKWREELIELQSMIEPAKNEEIARRAIHIAWSCLEKAENQAKMLKIYQNKALQHVESVGEKKDCVEVVRCKDCKHWSQNGWCAGLPVNGDDATYLEMSADDYCSYGERKEKE